MDLAMKEALRELEYELQVWKEEYQKYGPPGDGTSAMTKRDINFLERKIEALKKEVERHQNTIEKILQDVRDYQDENM